MKTIKIMMMVLALSVMYQFAAAQGSCPGNKVKMAWGTKGHGCNCKQKCVDQAEVATYQAMGWYIGPCVKFCIPDGWKLDDAASSSATSLNEIYPNPASGTVNITFTLASEGEVSFDVFDMTGRYVKNIAHDLFEEDANEVSWDTSELNKGIYFLRMKAGSYSAMKKLSVIK